MSAFRSRAAMIGVTMPAANAILSLDALAGIVHAHGCAVGHPEMAQHAEDEAYREALSRISTSYRALRDAAASLKHGQLIHPRRKQLARLVRSAKAFGATANTLGLFEAGDALGSKVVVIELDPGPGRFRASDVVADTYRMLKRIVEGEPARTDEHDRGDFWLGLSG